MQKVALWAGPVSTAMLAPVVPQDWLLVTQNGGIGGIGSSHFAALGREVGGIRGLLRARGFELDRVGPVALIGFSAAHGLFEILLRDPETIARCPAVVACDAYYTAHDAPAKPGYRAAVERAVAGRALFVLTTSSAEGPPDASGRPSYPSSRVAARTLFAGVPLAPLSLDRGNALGKGGALWWDFASDMTHSEHATVLAPELFRRSVVPYLNAPHNEADPSMVVAALGLAAIGAVLAGI